ncbi:tripartite tricarboxylate transporter TctB family protein [Bosea sp. (in: a-proteobacteria)]|jgi:hypothetical protein|uniref:tripartite tricarboxylate transporter TctB family protein n=1 Tax=Bosea sp. (in: a-proteobacteria) TaxID=1871050 RepID=UPI003F707FA2
MTESRSSGAATSPLNGDTVLGCLGFAFAGFAWWQLADLPLFEGFRVGAGYMPRLVLGCLVLVSAGLLLRGLMRGGEAIGRPALRPLVMVCLALGLFALLMERAGLAPASFVAVLVCTAAAHDVRPVRSLVLAVAITAAGLLLFVELLGLPVKVWP